jgi:hypothetical protein
MDREHIVESIMSKTNGRIRENNNSTITILHQNICSLCYKTLELEAWLGSELSQVDVICLAEHWLNDENLHSTSIINFKLVSAFSGTSRTHGGSCFYVKDSIVTKDIDYFTTLSEDKNFELSLIELVNYKIFIVCIYRSPDGQIEIFINKLETLIQKLITKKKSLLL